MIKSALDDYYQMRYISSPDHHGPSGQVAYTLTRPQPDRYEMQIRILDTKTGQERTISAGGRREHYPRFSPDGSRLAFLSDASGEDQIWLADLFNGTTRQLTRLRDGVREPAWSPDGSRLSFLNSCCRQTDDQEPVVIEDYGYKSDDAMGFSTRTVSHVWLVSADDGMAKCLTDGDRDHVMPAWSPDGAWLVLASNRCRPKSEFIGMDLFRVSADGGKLQRLTENVWIAYYPKPFPPLFTPDGRTIIFGALAPTLASGLPPTRLFKVPAEGGEVMSLWPEDAPCHEATCFLYNAENYGDFPQPAQISEDGNQVYFLSGWQGACNIYSARLVGEPAIEQITNARFCIRNLCRPQDGQLLLARGDFLSTPQLVLFDLESQTQSCLTDSNPWLSERSLSPAQELWIDTLDGKGQVHGFVLPPQQMEASGQYPAILYIHGGPTPFYGYALTYEYQLLAAAGFGVILCNPRGSSGYGEAHGDTRQATDGTAMVDLLQFTSAVVDTFPWIDGKRLGVTGGSYGGYMTNWLAAHSRRFKAAVSQRSVASNLISYASSDMAGSSKEYKDFSDFMKAELKKSPVAYADKIDIPFLILHSLGDMRCPVEQAHQLYTAIKDTHPDLPVRMVLFPDSNHSLTMEGPMRLRITHYQETIDWFKKHLQEE